MRLRMARFRLMIGIVASLAVAFQAVPVVAGDIQTTVDVGFTLTVERDGEDKTYNRELPIKAEMQYDGNLNALYSLAVKTVGGYTVKTKTDEADTRSIEASIDVKLSGPMVDLTTTYSGKKDNTESSLDVAEVNAFSSNYIVDLSTKPEFLPKLKLKWERKRDFESGVQEKLDNKVDLELTYEISDFKSDFKLSRQITEVVIPDGTKNDKTTWQLTLGYGREFFDLLDLQLDYDVKEDFTEIEDAPDDKTYIQTLKGSLKSQFDVLAGLTADVSYDYTLDQDLLLAKDYAAYDLSEFGYTTDQKLSVGFKRDIMHWITTDVKYEGVNERGGSSIDLQVDNKVSGSVMMKPWSWLDFETKGEGVLNTALQDAGDVETKKTYKYENNLNSTIGESLKFKASNSFEEAYTEDLLEKKTAKYKFESEFKSTPYMTVGGTYNVDRTENWDTSMSAAPFDGRTRNWDVQFKFNYDRTFSDILIVKADYSYSFKHEQEQTATLDMSEGLSMNEDSKINIRLQNIIRDLTVEVELSRKASDTKDDEEPLIEDRTLSVKCEWVLGDLSLSTDYKYDNLGDANDTMSFSSKVAYKRDLYEITGEYQLSKTFSDVIDTSDKYNLKFKMSF